LKPFAELSSGFALPRRVLAGERPARRTAMNKFKLTDIQWASIAAAWDQEPSRRPVLSPGGEPMISFWRPEIEAVQGVIQQPDLSAEEALHALGDLSRLMSPFEDNDASFRGVIKVFSFVIRLGDISIRRHEGQELRTIYMLVRIKLKPADYDSPYFKIFLLLQAHFSRLPLSGELAADLAIVLERVFSVFSMCSAHLKWLNSDPLLDAWRYRIFPLMHMCVHGMWDDDPELKQIPHFEGGVSGSIKRQGHWLTHASVYRPFSCSTHPFCA
jgi:hypothetical protein